MARRRLSFTERRRSRMAFKSTASFTLENRALITDPLNLFAVSLGIPLVGNVLISSGGGGSPETRELLQAGARAQAAAQAMPAQAQNPPAATLRIAIVPQKADTAGWLGDAGTAAPSAKTASSAAGDWLTLSPAKAGAASSKPLLSSPNSSQPLQAGGSSTTHGMGSLATPHGTISKLRYAPPSSSTSSAAASSALLSAAGSGLGNTSQPTSPGLPCAAGAGRRRRAGDWFVFQLGNRFHRPGFIVFVARDVGPVDRLHARLQRRRGLRAGL